MTKQVIITLSDDYEWLIDRKIERLKLEYDVTEANSTNKLFVYAKPNQMVNHKFSDDVAITYAENKAEAITKFSTLYSFIAEEDVNEVCYNSKGVAILTSY